MNSVFYFATVNVCDLSLNRSLLYNFLDRMKIRVQQQQANSGASTLSRNLAKKSSDWEMCCYSAQLPATPEKSISPTSGK